ncbi:uncharacterized protein LOC124158510 [Ischnura elegans]|uniref:uncharacterized protein LOC124158510 n=1 Tax=Ischnura elegans TaxID=197161 RepID=UPI001ED88CA7|nr:uncharacterized protein LOC124158510 [Ischnura elegans]
MDTSDEEVPLVSTKPFVTRVIEMFRDHPCLWDPMDPSYRDRYKRDDALDEILKLFLERNPKATRVTVWKRIQSLRGAFRKERNKVKMSRIAHSAGLGHIHVPRLWYYNLMKFLEDNEPYRQTRNPHIIVKRAIADGILKIEPLRPAEEDDTIGMVEEEVEGWEKDDDSIELDSSGMSASELSPAPQTPQPSQELSTSNVRELSTGNVRELSTSNIRELSTSNISLKRPPEQQQPEPVTIKIAKIRELSTSNISQLSTGNISQRSTNNIRELSTSNIRELSTNNIRELPTSNIREISTSNNKELSTSNNKELSTSNTSSKRPPEQQQQPEPVTIKIAKITTEPRQSQESSVVGGPSRRQHDVFGEHVAEKLRSLRPDMVPFCQKLINDAIFYAEMNVLGIRSRIMNN